MLQPTNRILPLIFILNFFCTHTWSGVSLAQIVRDGTVGPAVGSVVEPSGPNYQIDSTLGRIEGANLFHSFSDFNVQSFTNGTVESATFTNSLPVSIDNILSRVTGGKESTINGTLASTIDNANLFLLNPHGVVFGPNVALDLKGSFYASTADVLRFDNGQALYMDASLDGSMDSVLKMPPLVDFGFTDAPEFGFTSNTPASIRLIQGVLQVSEGNTLSLVARDILITEGGRIVSTITGSGMGGDISISADNLTIRNGGKVISESLGSGQGGNLSVMSTDAVTISGVGPLGSSGLVANTRGTGSTTGVGGNIVVESGTVTVSDGAEISSISFGSGKGGNVRVQASEGLTVSGESANSNSPVISFIRAETKSGGLNAGDAGDVEIEAGELSVKDGAVVSNRTDGSGQGGTLRVMIDSEVLVSGMGAQTQLISGIIADTFGKDTNAGDAGNVLVTGKTVTVSDGARISSISFGPGQGGMVEVRAIDALTVSGESGEFEFDGFRDFNVSRIAADAQGDGASGGEAGNAGKVRVTGGKITVKDGGLITSRTFGPGQGNTVTVMARDALIVSSESIKGTNPRPSAISASTGGKGVNSGDAGDVVVEARSITIRDGGTISSVSLGPGEGGMVSVRGHDTVTVSGMGTLFRSGILSQAGGEDANAGNANSIVVIGDTVMIRDRGELSTSTVGSGNAGDITVAAKNLIGLSGAGISSDSVSSSPNAGAPGSIGVHASNAISLSGARISTTAAGGTVASIPGNITLQANEEVSLQAGTTIFTTNIGAGRAGDIEIKGVGTTSRIKEENGKRVPLVNIIRLQDSQIRTDSNSDSGGNIDLNADLLIQVLDSVITSEIGAGTAGGNITFDPQFIVLQGNTRVSTAATSTEGGDGGAIILGQPGDILFVGPSVTLDVSSQVGQGGTLSIGATTQSLSEEVPRPDVAIIDPQSFLPVRCASQQGGTFSSIVETGLDALPLEPGDFFPSPLPFVDESTTIANSVNQPSVSIESLRFGFSSMQDGLDQSSQIVFASSLAGCAL